MKTKVVFRKWRRKSFDVKDDIIAVFPEVPGS